MPSTAPLPSIHDLILASHDAIVGQRGALLDVRAGSGYEIPAGVNAILMARQARRDQKLFGNAYTDTSSGPDCDRHVLLKYKVARVEAEYGQGFVSLVRPTAGAGGGTIYAGTRIEVVHPALALPPAQYRVSQDTIVPASALSASVPIEAVLLGSGVAVTTSSNLRLADGVYDATFVPTSIVCADGTDEETDDAYRARARGTQLDLRPGYDTSIVQAMLDAGAVNVVLLGAGALGPSLDFGLNYLYVGDAGCSTSAALVQACMVALDAVRVGGCDTQVLPMVLTNLSLSVTVSLWDDPGKFNLLGLQQLVAAVILDQFNLRQGWWTFRIDALQGVAQGVSSAIQSVSITSNPAPPAVTFPSALPKYVITNLSISFQKGT